MRALVLFGLAASSLWADFSYTQTTQMTGGALLNMMRSLPVGGGLKDPTTTTHLLKGNRLATITKDTTTVIDLDKETITMIDAGKKTYSVMTFQQMQQALANLQSRMSNNKAPAAKYKVSANATGQTKTIQGQTAKEVVMTMTVEATDQKSGQTGGMDISVDSWMAPVPGYEQIQDFQRRMGQKMGYLFGSGMSQVAAMQPGAGEGFAQVAEEMAKVEGMPVEQITKMGSGSAMPSGPSGQTPQARPSASDAVAGALAGRLGGLGGFGRRKKEEKKEEKTEEPAAAAAPASSGALMEMTSTLTSFSSGAVDGSKFEIPAGFKQVENDLVKRTR